MSPEAFEAALREALALIAATPGWETVAQELGRKRAAGRLVFVPELPDRGQASLLGTIRIGPEPLAEGPLALAATLVHESYHCRQNPFEKTASFWQGVATRTPVMARYERPAYRHACDFLRALAKALPACADAARREADAIRESFTAHYRLGA